MIAPTLEVIALQLAAAVLLGVVQEAIRIEQKQPLGILEAVQGLTLTRQNQQDEAMVLALTSLPQPTNPLMETVTGTSPTNKVQT